MSIETLIHITTPPVEPWETGTSKNWEKIEKRLGLQLPQDYKAFIDTYGTGNFDDFIIVYNPFAQNEYLNLFYALDTFHQADEQTRLLGDPVWTAVHPFELYPAPNGLLPWGCTTNIGDTIFWQISGPPETWETIFYNLRSGEHEVWKYPMSEFLSRLFTRQIESVLLPKDFPWPDEKIKFIPANPAKFEE
jgi:hypothetical protein